MFFTQIRYNGMIRSAAYLLDLAVINYLAFLIVDKWVASPWLFHGYISFAWIIISIKNEFYKETRLTKVPHILRSLSIQFFFFFLSLYSFIGFFKQPDISRLALAQFFLLVCAFVFTLKFLSYTLWMKYRERLKGSIKNVVVIGGNKKARQLIDVFRERSDFGYRIQRHFSPKEGPFRVSECLEYITDHGIDEIYCSVMELSDPEMEEFINYADNNLKTLKFIPDNKNIFAKRLKFEYYDYIPVLSLRDIPLHNPINAFLKRAFDVIFSLLVIVLLLSWLTPLLALIITLESKGTVFFRQRRTGIDGREFFCYKFRSMTPNANADKSSATKNDLRVTKVGKLIRRTSIDELPQFYNVLFGTMSVVGPRPHMVKHTSEFAYEIDKFMVRHFIKPGITGLAQVKGYRGEIESKADIHNRIKLDIFYVENWSLFLDMKIVLQTVLNIFKKEDKAY